MDFGPPTSAGLEAKTAQLLSTSCRDWNVTYQTFRAEDKLTASLRGRSTFLPRRGFITKPRVALRAPWEHIAIPSSYPEGVAQKRHGILTMPQSLCQICLRIVFSTKERKYKMEFHERYVWD
jgi:hypothetical protein